MALPAPNEHRKLPRYEDHLLVRIDDQGNERDALTADISLSGARLRLPVPLTSSVGGTVDMQILVPIDDLDAYEQQQPLRLNGRILWERAGEEGEFYGVEFTQLDDTQRAQLKRCFEFFNQKPTYAGR